MVPKVVAEMRTWSARPQTEVPTSARCASLNQVDDHGLLSETTVGSVDARIVSAWLEVRGRLNAVDNRTGPARTLGVGPCGACVRAAHLRGAPRSDASRLHHSRI